MIKCLVKIVTLMALFAGVLSMDKPVSIQPSYIEEVRPQPLRDLPNREFMSSSCRITYKDSCGSGTIVYFNSKSQEAWVLSCGHLFAKQGKMRTGQLPEIDCALEFFYHNNQRLKYVDTYKAKVEFYYIQGYEDISLIKFVPNWTPEYMKIAPLSHHVEDELRSIGCDGATETAHYGVRYIGLNMLEYVTSHNSPRPGRSGGGLLCDDKMLVGVCCRTSDVRGCGLGFYSPLSQIHEILKREQFDWLLSVPLGSKVRHVSE